MKRQKYFNFIDTSIKRQMQYISFAVSPLFLQIRAEIVKKYTKTHILLIILLFKFLKEYAANAANRRMPVKSCTYKRRIGGESGETAANRRDFFGLAGSFAGYQYF